MEIKKPAIAGTLESSDCQIMIRPNGGEGISIYLENDVWRFDPGHGRKNSKGFRDHRRLCGNP